MPNNYIPIPVPSDTQGEIKLEFIHNSTSQNTSVADETTFSGGMVHRQYRISSHL